MFDPQTIVIGNLVADPQLAFTKDGYARASFRVASTRRRFDRTTGEWRDGETLFTNVTCWRALAENVNSSLHRGQAVIVIGRPSVRAYETRDGVKRESLELEAAVVGPDLARAIALVKRAERGAPLNWVAGPSADANSGEPAAAPAALGAESADDDVFEEDEADRVTEGELDGDLQSDGHSDVHSDVEGIEDVEYAAVGSDPVTSSAGPETQAPPDGPEMAGAGGRRKARFGLG